MAQYAEIVEIVAPAEAAAGTRVDIVVRIKNLSASTITILAGGALEYGVTPWPAITYPADKADVPGNWVGEFNGHFTMPDSDVIMHAYSYFYGDDGFYHFDDEETKHVEIAELVPVFDAMKVTQFEKGD